MSNDNLLNITALKRALIEATGPGKNWSRRALSLSIGMGPDWVRDIISGRNKSPGIEAALALSQKLQIDPAEFLNVNLGPEVHEVPIVGKVAAGVWREPDVSSMDEVRTLPLTTPAPMGFRGRRFAVEVDGESMNKVFPAGSFLDCMEVFTSGLSPEPGQYVIVERNRSGLRETTAKLLAQRADGHWELRAESTLPEFANPIPIGLPSTNHTDDQEIRIIGVILGSYRPLRMRGIHPA